VTTILTVATGQHECIRDEQLGRGRSHDGLLDA